MRDVVKDRVTRGFRRVGDFWEKIVGKAEKVEKGENGKYINIG